VNVIAIECEVELVAVMFSMADQSMFVVAYLHCAVSLVVTLKVTVDPEDTALIAVTVGAVVSVIVNWCLTIVVFAF
jgi:hypothetical protein